MDDTRATANGTPPANTVKPPRDCATERLDGSVLIVDDDRPNRVVMRKLLEERGCVVNEAADGAEALRLVAEQRPDLALVDIMMPGMNGYDVCRTIKTTPDTRDVSVILVTARREAEDVEHGLELGAFDYIRKPFHSRELLARVRNALALKRSTDELRVWQQKMSRELDIAGSLQRRLFSTHPRFGPGYEVQMAYQPSLTVGGDVFDAIPLPEGRLCVYAGDVAGHGVGPAIVSSLLKAIVTEAARALAMHGPAAICREIHARFRYHVENPEMYATLFLAILEPVAAQWTCMCCGHPNPILILSDGTDGSETLAEGGDMPIGFHVRDAGAYASVSESHAPATAGSTLLLFTDGLFEARHRETGEPCGTEHLLTIAREALADTLTVNPAAALFTSLRREGFELREDDCSALAVSVIDPLTVRLTREIPLDVGAVTALAEDAQCVLRDERWPDEAARAVQLVIMEYGTNVVKHGGGPAQSTIHFQLRIAGDTCRLLFRDEGREWDFGAQASASESQPKDREHRRGLTIIQAVTCHCEHFRQGNENIAYLAVARGFAT